MKSCFFVVGLFLALPLIAKEPQLSCEKKIGQMTWQGVVFHRYRLRAENFPPQQTYKLVVKSFDGTMTETFKYSSNRKGHLILQPPEDIEGDIYAICPVKRGERLTFAMQSEEGEDVYETDVIPFPLEMRSKKGVKLSLELQGEQGEKFLLFAQGFKPHEEIRLFLNTEGTEIPLNSKVTSLGDLCTHIDLPIGSSGGEAHLVIKRKSEDVVFVFEWGAPALKIVGACCFEIK